MIFNLCFSPSGTTLPDDSSPAPEKKQKVSFGGESSNLQEEENQPDNTTADQAETPQSILKSPCSSSGGTSSELDTSQDLSISLGSKSSCCSEEDDEDEPSCGFSVHDLEDRFDQVSMNEKKAVPVDLKLPVLFTPWKDSRQNKRLFIEFHLPAATISTELKVSLIKKREEHHLRLELKMSPVILNIEDFVERITGILPLEIDRAALALARQDTISKLRKKHVYRLHGNDEVKYIMCKQEIKLPFLCDDPFVEATYAQRYEGTGQRFCAWVTRDEDNDPVEMESLIVSLVSKSKNKDHEDVQKTPQKLKLGEGSNLRNMRHRGY